MQFILKMSNVLKKTAQSNQLLEKGNFCCCCAVIYLYSFRSFDSTTMFNSRFEILISLSVSAIGFQYMNQQYRLFRLIISTILESPRSHVCSIGIRHKYQYRTIFHTFVLFMTFLTIRTKQFKSKIYNHLVHYFTIPYVTLIK